jgi:hypothetical protein
MGITIGILIFVILGVIISRLSGLIGSKTFNFSDRYRNLFKHFKKNE